ncbi:hypothetical protein C8J57DRAFT_1525782 [Mycena rebaudengoi]|nr:hypothetical protein C8J57DRAFT_1525782 [Mycena rebaudengoi]
MRRGFCRGGIFGEVEMMLFYAFRHPHTGSIDAGTVHAHRKGHRIEFGEADLAVTIEIASKYLNTDGAQQLSTIPWADIEAKPSLCYDTLKFEFPIPLRDPEAFSVTETLVVAQFLVSLNVPGFNFWGEPITPDAIRANEPPSSPATADTATQQPDTVVTPPISPRTPTPPPFHPMTPQSPVNNSGKAVPQMTTLTAQGKRSKKFALILLTKMGELLHQLPAGQLAIRPETKGPKDTGEGLCSFA